LPYWDFWNDLDVKEMAEELCLAGWAAISVSSWDRTWWRSDWCYRWRPGLLHSIVGLINTLINVYTAQDGHWSVTAIVTIAIIGLCMMSMSVLTLVYKNWLLEEIKTPRDRELAEQGKP
jgi:hypothetical protein